MAKTTDDIFRCVSDHPGAVEQKGEKKKAIINRALKHRFNLDFLQILSPGCENIVNLIAYQKLPFPFYVTEAISQRLLERLIDHRKSHQWICNDVMLGICQDVLCALEYMLSRRIVTRDLTSYSMLVDNDGAASRDSSTVKLADLSLALTLPKGADNVKDTR
jgi:serine/threonine protein kinase